MYADVLLTVIALHLFLMTLFAFQAMRILSRFNPEIMIRRSVIAAMKGATSKAALSRIERNTMPFIIKVVVVKVASALLIRYIGKKFR